MKREYSIIAAPVITEKGTFVNEIGNQVVFQVRPDANKLEIKAAVEAIYNSGRKKEDSISVTSVRTIKVLGKKKRRGQRSCRHATRPDRHQSGYSSFRQVRGSAG